MKNDEFLNIYYLLIDDSAHKDKATIYHLLDEALVYHLRSFMTLLLLPADTYSLDPEKPTFSSALHRVMTPPTILRTPTKRDFEEKEWSFLCNTPLLILLVNGQIPKWAIDLANKRPLGLLTPSDQVAEKANEEGCFQVGLLKGFTDILESYRVIEKLIRLCLERIPFPAEKRNIIERIAQRDLFNERPRLIFFDPIPLPSPHGGRPAAFLINRLSNNVDKPSLMSDDPQDSFLIMPRILDYSFGACLFLSGFEMGFPVSHESPFSPTELEDQHSYFLSDAPKGDKKNRFLQLGEKIVGSRALKSPLFVSVPAARIDLIKHPLPSISKFEPKIKQSKNLIFKVLADHLKGHKESNFRSKTEERGYKEATETLVAGHRLISIQTACLATSEHAIPIQTPEIGGSLYAIAKDFNTAFTNRSFKAPDLFRKFEIALGDALPKELVAHLALGNSPIVFYSDLPFEWALLDYWPVCLTRPVSRIPLGATDLWLDFPHRAENGVNVNTNCPQKVLILDLIDKNDPIRPFFEDFRKTSDGIGQKYTYRRPSSPEELRDIVIAADPEIVVLDTHGNYQKMLDELVIYFGNRPVKARDFLSATKVPPVWILSACDMSVIGSLRGSLVEPLLKRGAICVIASVQKVDALAATFFVGRLLTDIYSPPFQMKYETLLDAFFSSQFTTALLYDPLLPLLRRAPPGSELAGKLSAVILGYLTHFSNKQLESRKFRYEAAEVLSHNLNKQGLLEQYLSLFQTGQILPETLLFTAFGLPSKVHLIKDTCGETNHDSDPPS